MKNPNNGDIRPKRNYLISPDGKEFWDLDPIEAMEKSEPKTEPIPSTYSNDQCKTPDEPKNTGLHVRTISPQLDPAKKSTSLFGRIKSKVAKIISNTAEVAQTSVHKYWKPTATLALATILWTSTNSKNQKNFTSDGSPDVASQMVETITTKIKKNAIPEDTSSSGGDALDSPITPITTKPSSAISKPTELRMIRPTKVDKNMTQTTPSAEDETHTISPLLQELQKKETTTNIPSSGTSLFEAVLGKENPSSNRGSHDAQSMTDTMPQSDQTPSVEIDTIPNMPSIPLFVISKGGETTFIVDRDEDGKISIGEKRRGYFDTVGGNYNKYTKKMYKMADELGLNVENITSKNQNTTVSYSDITSGIPVVEMVSIDGTSYTISANSDIALELGKKHLEKKNIPEEVKVDPTTEVFSPQGNISTPESSPEVYPRAIPVPMDELERLGEISSFGELLPDVLPPGVGVLPDLHTLPILGNSDALLRRRAQSYQSTINYLSYNGRYDSYSQILLPETREEAQIIIEGFLGTLDAIREASQDDKQRNMSLDHFFQKYVTFVDKNQHIKSITLGELMREYAQYTDREIAGAMGNKIPTNIIDASPYDGKLPALTGTWDTHGWSEALKLIQKGAKSIYGDSPTIEEMNEYFRKNVSLGSHPEITNYSDLIKLVEKEEVMAQIVKKESVKTKPEVDIVTSPNIKVPVRQYTWVSVSDNNEIIAAVKMIEHEFEVSKKDAEIEDREFPYKTVQTFADARFRIIDTNRRVIPYGAALMKHLPR